MKMCNPKQALARRWAWIWVGMNQVVPEYTTIYSSSQVQPTWVAPCPQVLKYISSQCMAETNHSGYCWTKATTFILSCMAFNLQIMMCLPWTGLEGAFLHHWSSFDVGVFDWSNENSLLETCFGMHWPIRKSEANFMIVKPLFSTTAAHFRVVIQEEMVIITD